MEYIFSEEHLALRREARKFYMNEIAPHAIAVDRGERSTFDHWPKLVEQGFFAPGAPEELGGLGVDLVTNAILSIELARTCPSTALSLGASVLLCGGTIVNCGTEEQQQRYARPIVQGEKIGCWAMTEPDAGSDMASIKSTARRDGDGWVLNGSKTFITNAPVADIFVVYAVTAKGMGHNGMSAFVLEKGMEGLGVGKPMKKMGFRGSPTSEIFLDEVKIPGENLLGNENMGFWEALPTLTAERALSPFLALGMMERCLELSIAYAKEREVFGKPISHKQGIQFKIARMYTLTEHVRAMAWNLLMMKMQEIDHVKEASAAKYFCGEAALEVALDAVQIHGGYGYTEEYEVERFVRDAKLISIGAGTTEIQKLIISRELLKG